MPEELKTQNENSANVANPPASTEATSAESTSTSNNQTVITPPVDPTVEGQTSVINQMKSEITKPDAKVKTESTEVTPPANTEVKPPEAKNDKVETVTAPTEYELELSENSPLSEADLDAVVELAIKYKLPEDQAKQLLAKKEELYNKGMKDLQEKAVKNINEQAALIRKHPDFSGEKLEETLNTIDLAVEKFDTDGSLRAFLNNPSSNNIGFLNFIHSVGKSLKTGGNIPGKGQSSGGSGDQKTALQAMYPDFYKKDS